MVGHAGGMSEREVKVQLIARIPGEDDSRVWLCLVGDKVAQVTTCMHREGDACHARIVESSIWYGIDPVDSDGVVEGWVSCWTPGVDKPTVITAGRAAQEEHNLTKGTKCLKR